MSKDTGKISDASGGDAPQEKRTLDTKNILLRRRTAPNSSTEHNTTKPLSTEQNTLKHDLAPKNNTIIVQNPDGDIALGVEIPVSSDQTELQNTSSSIEDSYSDSPAHRRDMRKERIATRRRNRRENSPYLLQNVVKRTEEFDSASSKMTTQERIAHLKKLKEAQQLPQISSYTGQTVTTTPQIIDTSSVQDATHKTLLASLTPEGKTPSQPITKETAIQRLRRVLQEKQKKPEHIENINEHGNIPTKELQKRYELKKHLQKIIENFITKIGIDHGEKGWDRLLQDTLNSIQGLEETSPKFIKYVRELQTRNKWDIRSGKDTLRDDDKITVHNSSAQNVGKVFEFGRKIKRTLSDIPNFFYKGYSPIEFNKDTETGTEKLMQELLSFVHAPSIEDTEKKRTKTAYHTPHTLSSNTTKQDISSSETPLSDTSQKMETLKNNALKLVRRLKGQEKSADPVRLQQMATKNILDTTRRTPENPAIL